jgi:hypothetical protein
MDAITPLRPAHAAVLDGSSAEAQMQTWDYALGMLRVDDDEEKVACPVHLSECLRKRWIPPVDRKRRVQKE